MTDPFTVPTIFGMFKAIKDGAQTIVNTHDAAIRQAKSIELQSMIIDAQTGILALQEERSAAIQRVGDLEKEVAELKAWGAEKERYQLCKVGSGSFAYEVKPDARGTEPPHKICANCYQIGKKSFLHEECLSPGRSFILGCQACGGVIYIQGLSHKDHTPRIAAYKTK